MARRRRTLDVRDAVVHWLCRRFYWGTTSWRHFPKLLLCWTSLWPFRWQQLELRGVIHNKKEKEENSGECSWPLVRNNESLTAHSVSMVLSHTQNQLSVGVFDANSQHIFFFIQMLFFRKNIYLIFTNPSGQMFAVHFHKSIQTAMFTLAFKI